MNSRERVFRAVEFGGPDRPPVIYNVLPGFELKYPRELANLHLHYPSDFAETGFTEFEEFTKEVGVGERDAWGALWVRYTDDNKGLIVEHPLDDWAKLEGYRFPDPVQAGDWSRVPEMLARNAGEKYVLADGETLFQRMFYLRGFENLMMDILDESPELFYLRDRIVEFMLRKIEKWLEYPVDCFRFRDDWGTQNQLFINPAKWRKIFKPAYKRLFDAVHGAGKHVFFHSDGNIFTIIPDLIELGANVLNPQPAAIGVDALGAAFAGKICFMGDINRQTVLPFGTPAEVEAYVLKEASTLGTARGGYIGNGELGADVPPANAEALHRAFFSYRYGAEAAR
ncbi:MAG TPA: uroporphyrinogen decarboxylase family protein [Chloroflexota bacterium]